MALLTFLVHYLVSAFSFLAANSRFRTDEIAAPNGSCSNQTGVVSRNVLKSTYL